MNIRIQLVSGNFITCDGVIQNDENYVWVKSKDGIVVLILPKHQIIFAADGVVNVENVKSK